MLFRSGDALVRGDQRAIERAIGNLIANAGRFAASTVGMECTLASASCVIDVDDDGPGIPVADRERIFDPFVRLEDSGRGAGLGLTLVRRIVGCYGGTATAYESPLGGCRIRLVLPAALADATAVA